MVIAAAWVSPPCRLLLDDIAALHHAVLVIRDRWRRAGCFLSALTTNLGTSPKMTSVSRINVRLAFNSVQVLLATGSANVQQLKHHLSRTLSSAADQLRVVRKGALLKDSAMLADGDSVTAHFPSRGGSTCVESPISPHSPFTHVPDGPRFFSSGDFSAPHDTFSDCDVTCDPSDFDEDADDFDVGAISCLGAHVGSMKTLRRLQSSAPKSSAKLFGNRSNLMSSDYAELALGFMPPKLRAKAVKTSLASREEQAAASFQGALEPGQHRGVVESAAGKNFRVRSLLDNRVRDCRIKGLLKRHVQINCVVVFEPSLKFGDDDHGDIVWRHFDKEVEQLQADGLLPEPDVLWPKPAVVDNNAAPASSRKAKSSSRAA